MEPGQTPGSSRSRGSKLLWALVTVGLSVLVPYIVRQWRSGHRARALVILIAIVAIVIAATGSGGTTETKTAPTAATATANAESSASAAATTVVKAVVRAKPLTYGQILRGKTTKEAAAMACTSLSGIAVSWETKATGFMKARAPALDSPYAAERYTQASQLTSDASGRFTAERLGAARAALKMLTIRQPTAAMVSAYLADATFVCRLGAQMRATEAVTANADTAASQILSLAASVPWYPEGFQETSPGLALQWVEHPSCDYGYCWQARIVAKEGCPSAGYAEIKVIDRNDVVIDSANDLLPNLDPMQQALLTFTTMGDYSGPVRGQLADLKCY